jgi:hypothetical protein
MTWAWAIAAIPFCIAGYVLLAKINIVRSAGKRTGTLWVSFGLVLAVIAFFIILSAG